MGSGRAYPVGMSSRWNVDILKVWSYHLSCGSPSAPFPSGAPWIDVASSGTPTSVISMKVSMLEITWRKTSIGDAMLII